MMSRAIITGCFELPGIGCTVACANHITEACGLISIARLNMSPCVHLLPIYLVVFQEALREYLSWSVLRA